MQRGYHVGSRETVLSLRSSMAIYPLVIHNFFIKIDNSNCCHFMPKVEKYFVMLGMKSHRNCFHIVHRVDNYYVMLGMKTYKNLLL